MVEYSNKGITVQGVFVSYEDIDRERNKIRFANHVLVELEQRYGRDWYVDKFIMECGKWEEWKAKLQKHGDVYIGEIAGKHSEVVFTGTIKSEITDVEEISSYYSRSGWGQWEMNVLERLEEDYDPES